MESFIYRRIVSRLFSPLSIDAQRWIYGRPQAWVSDFVTAHSKSLLFGLLINVCLFAAVPLVAAQSNSRLPGLKFVPSGLRWGLLTPYPMDIVMGSRDAALFLFYYAKPVCDDRCKSRIDERINSVELLQPELKKRRLAVVFRPIVENEQEARAAMAFLCMPESTVIPKFLEFLKNNDGKTLPVPERYIDAVRRMGGDPAAYMACVNDQTKWQFYMGHTSFLLKDISKGSDNDVWINGVPGSFKTDYLRTYLDFITTAPDFSKSRVLKETVSSDIVIGDPSPDRVRVTIYLTPDGKYDAKFFNKTLQKFLQVYVGNGDVYVVLRILNWYRTSSTKAAQFLYCVPSGLKRHILEQMYASLARWKVNEDADPSATLVGLASFNGLNSKKVSACLTSKRTIANVERDRQKSMDELKIIATPTVLFDDQLFKIGSPTFAELMQEMRRRELVKKLNKRPSSKQ